MGNRELDPNTYIPISAILKIYHFRRGMEEKSSNYMGGKDKPNSGTSFCN
ncbi:hypothetical protein [Olivibacter jilunii]|nr:hypothetical protein [Olivibacter jilunii]